MKKITKNKLFRILSIILMLFAAVLTTAGTCSYCGFYCPDPDPLVYKIDDEYLTITIYPYSDPNNFVVYENAIYIHFEDRQEYQKFWNYVSNDGENLSMSVIIDRSSDPEIVEIIIEGEFVFETFVEDDFFIIKIKKDLLKYDDIKILEIYLYNQDSRRMEIYK